MRDVNPTSNYDFFSMPILPRARSEKKALIMKVNRNILDKLENMGYLNKIKLGRENEFTLTESGMYIASISGLIQIKPEEIIEKS